MRTVIERLETNHPMEFKDKVSTYEQAETIAGRRLDRRKNYAIISGAVCESTEWTQPCSGCSCDTVDGYPCGCCDVRGAGCEECGYTGRSVQAFWVPLILK